MFQPSWEMEFLPYIFSLPPFDETKNYDFYHLIIHLFISKIYQSELVLVSEPEPDFVSKPDSDLVSVPEPDPVSELEPDLASDPEPHFVE